MNNFLGSLIFFIDMTTTRVRIYILVNQYSD